MKCSTKWLFLLVDGNKAVLGQGLSLLSVSQEDLSQKWGFATGTLEVEGFYTISSHSTEGTFENFEYSTQFLHFRSCGKPQLSREDKLV